MFTTKEKYAVIGLGTFGYTLARRLAEGGSYVIAVDRDMEKVEQVKDEVADSVCFDATDIELLHKLSITQVDIVIISIGEDNFKDAEFIALELQESGVNQIYVAVNSVREERIIQKIGITNVINPKTHAAEFLAANLSDHHNSV